jgi:MSHA pilin protein MshC
VHRAPLHRSRGYTLVELMVVLSVMGTLAAVAGVRTTDRTALQTRGFVEELRAMLRHSRAVAVAQQRDVCVLLMPTQAAAVYDRGAGCDTNQPVAMPGNQDAFVIAVPPGVALGGVTLVHFNPAGQPVPNLNQVITVGVQTLTVSRETGVTP